MRPDFRGALVGALTGFHSVCGWFVVQGSHSNSVLGHKEVEKKNPTQQLRDRCSSLAADRL